jgi:hypothetical protein
VATNLEAFDLALEAAAKGSPTGQFAEISDQPMPADHQPRKRTAAVADLVSEP